MRTLKNTIEKMRDNTSLFIEDTIINKLNGYYLRVYANGHPRYAYGIIFLSACFVNMMVFLHLIPERINYKNYSS
ncbi:MAG: hypothetical protein ACMUJM_06585 [bacterium]